MGKPDALSRRSDHPKGQGDNSDITLLDPALFEIRSTKTTIVKGPKADLLNRIKSATDFDEPVVKALRELDSKGIYANEWERSEGMVLHCGRVYVPRDQCLHADILSVRNPVPSRPIVLR